MTNVRNYHLIVDRKIHDNRRHVYDFIDADFSCWEIILLYFWNGLNSQTQTLVLASMLI